MKRRIFALLCVVILFSSCSGISTIAGISDKTSIEYFFPRQNQHPDKALVRLISSAHRSLDIAIYSLTRDNIVNAIIEAEARGISVRLITDRETSQNEHEQMELSRLLHNNIPIKINTHKGLMHLKMTIVDDKSVTTGSYNYTDAATYNNDEVLVIIHDNRIATDFRKEFNRMWNSSKNFRLLEQE